MQPARYSDGVDWNAVVSQLIDSIKIKVIDILKIQTEPTQVWKIERKRLHMKDQ